VSDGGGAGRGGGSSNVARIGEKLTSEREDQVSHKGETVWHAGTSIACEARY